MGSDGVSAGATWRAGAGRQVFVHRLVAEFRHQIVAAAFFHQARYRAVGIAEIAEMPRLRGACGYASGHTFGFRQAGVVDAVDAQRALLHHAGIFIELARAIRARPGAQLAANTGVGVDQHDAILGAFVGRAGGTDRDAGGFLTVKTGAREIHRAAVVAFAGLVAVHAVEPHTLRLRLVGIEIR